MQVTAWARPLKNYAERASARMIRTVTARTFVALDRPEAAAEAVESIARTS